MGMVDRIDISKEEVEALQKQLQAAQEEIRELKLENLKLSGTGQEPDFSVLRRQLCQKSAEARRNKCRLGTAVALSAAVRGAPTGEISRLLAERGLSDSAAFISKVLSAREPEDEDRLKCIMSEFPEEFVGVAEEEFMEWFSKWEHHTPTTNLKPRAKIA